MQEGPGDTGAAGPAHPGPPNLQVALGRGGGTLHKQVGAGEMPEHPWGTLTLGAHLGHPMVATVLERT